MTIYQGVTLGGTGKEHGKRHPTLGDNIVVGSGASVLGSVKIGDNAKIGSGSVVVHDVPANATVVGNPGHPVLVDGQRVGIPDIDYTHLPDPVAEALKCVVDRIIALEQELDEIDPKRKERRRGAGRPQPGEARPAAALQRRGRHLRRAPRQARPAGMLLSPRQRQHKGRVIPP